MDAICNLFFRYATCLSLLILCRLQEVKGQNLVPNPSFEDINTCSEFNQPCSPSAWFYLSRKFTTGYFPLYRSATGARHLQIVAASRATVNRQYWETMLLCPLQAGQRYTISLKVAAPRTRTDLSTTCPNLRDIGFWFTTRFVFVHGDSILQPRSYLSFTNASVKDLKNGWFELHKEYVPTHDAAILIVGNFSRLENVDIMDQRNSPNPTIDILVDDISIVPINAAVCPNYQRTKDSLYAIHRRHSENQPPGNGRDIPDSLPDFAGNSTPPTQADPGVTDTPKSSVPPPIIDTIIIPNIQFDFDKYLIQNPDTLQRYRILLTRSGIRKIQVVGFTDDAGSDAYNLDLSQKRAREIASLLSSKFDIPPDIIDAEGKGISRKYADKSRDRRVEIYIFH